MASNNTIRFSLMKSYLSTEAGESYHARVHRLQTIDQAGLVDLMTGKNTTVTRQDIIVVMDLLTEVVREQLIKGNAVNTDIFRTVASIKGHFTSIADEFSNDRHSIEVNMSPARSLEKKVAFEAIPEKERQTKRLPEIDSLLDYRTGTYNTILSAGYSAEIKGINLDEYTENADQGVFFVNELTAEKTKVEQITKISGTKIVFSIPETLSNGQYTLIVKRVFGGEMREGRLNKTIQVGTINPN